MQETVLEPANTDLRGLELLTTSRVSELTGIPARTFTNYRTRGGGPRFLRVGRRVYYRPADIAAWLAEQARESTTDA